ncbi:MULTISPECIES: deoxyribose-phosphate aldolase [unclassified Corallococcus]|uniref:deoxyribose-phosphate aldolase n=1 Tax=unclassified Corallococcus TaxID=2685029 RepID=UPI001A8C0954|nr:MULTISPECIES: deoxyribose-phosphate aldolase [unclassified Corallococcus]MBN9683224.1 deoxyribose-phosphate aldolase [Corallococcus sp. NCSPR001]WAS85250.1 deoxyribose-phosphate aldolase [Corallococcus sp. NCRR]
MPSDAEAFFTVLEELVDQARHRLHAWKVQQEAVPPAPAAVLNPEAPRPPGVKTATARVDPATLVKASDLAPYIDHTLLKPEARTEDIVRVAEEARQYGFATVCVNSCHVATAARVLAGSNCVPIAVVGFPLGAALSSAKAFEAREAIRAGAREIDMVLNLGALKAHDYQRVHQDIAEVVQASHPVPVKVILETGHLTDEEKVVACALSKAAGAAFVKTSTGFGPGGATVKDIELMRAVVGDDVGVKASGGVRSAEDAVKLIRAGANRLGASASVAIVTGQISTAQY